MADFGSSSGDESAPPGLVRRMGWRILPLLGAAYLFAYMDRVNIGFAALQMNADLGFSATVYGLGGGLFFLAYALFEVPSNLILPRVGARRWIARIMITWGLIAAGMMFVHKAWEFYLLRFLLGAAEAGFFPGVVFYMAHWFPKAVRGRALSVIYMLGALTGVIIGALSPFLLSLEGAQGLHGWQWLFLVEGLPAAIIGLLVLFLLPDSPESARWLSDAEKGWIARTLAAEAEAHGAAHAYGILKALRHPQVWRLSLFGFFSIGMAITFTLNAPQLLRAATGFDAAHVGRLTSLAGLLGAGGILIAAMVSDRRGERFSTMVTSTALVGFCFAIMGATVRGEPTWFLAAFLVWAFAIWAVSFSNIMCWPDLLPRHLLAVGCAAINSVSQVGAFVMPFAWGAAQDATGGYQAGLWGLAIAAALSVPAALAARSKAGERRLLLRPA
ncbi:MAG: transporter, family, tartrate transporter [Alphaproteobacteria bacterium]|nr:transporter, family, tartrate transporter [Alphaproteobacteria bacterium]